MEWLVKILVMFSTLIIIESVEKNDMYMENSGSEDMEMSATGYAYQTHSGLPFRYTNTESDSPISRKFNNYYHYPPLGYGHYKYQKLKLHSIPLSSNYVPRHYDRLFNSYGTPISYAAFTEPVKGYEAMRNPTKKSYSEANNYGLGAANFIKSGGLTYEDAEKDSHGENGEREYLNRDEYEKGSKGEYGNAQQQGHYNKVGGNTSGHKEVTGHYGNKEQTSKGNLGESFADKIDHDRGSKTTGYHKVYHKDDYKKEHSFYDKADKRGHFKKYGDYNAKQAAQQGDFEKGRHHNSGFAGDIYGAKDLSDKNRFVDESSGYKGLKGKQKYYQNNAEYSNNVGKESSKAQGLEEGDKYSAVGQ